MKKILPISLLFIFISIVYFHIASASLGFTGSPFGGKITHSVATEIQTLQATHNCTVPGTTLTIRPFGSYPTSYLIPYGTVNKTVKTPTAGRFILGLYSTSKTTITCTLKATPFTPTTVNLNNITLFGTS